MPQNFVTDYELDRLEFDTNGKVIKMDDNKRQMLITYYFVFYQFLFRCLTKPWSFDNQKSETFPKRLFLRTLGSILYHFFNDHLKKQVPFIGNTQNHISIENRISARTPKYLFFDDRMAQENEYVEKEDIFGDLFTKMQLKMVFLEKIAHFDQISILVASFLKKFCAIINTSHQSDQEYEKKKRRFELLNQKLLTVKYLNRIGIDFVSKNSNKELIGELDKAKKELAEFDN